MNDLTLVIPAKNESESLPKVLEELKEYDLKNQSHIFITGLPRSGTTSLLNFLYSSNQYASLTYRNMPFVLSPNLSK